MDEIHTGIEYKGLPIMYDQPKCRDGFFTDALEVNRRLLYFSLEDFTIARTVKVEIHLSLANRTGFPYPKDNSFLQDFIGFTTDYFKCHQIKYKFFWKRERDLVPCPGTKVNYFDDQEYPNPHQHYHMYWVFPYQHKGKPFSMKPHFFKLKSYWATASNFVGKVSKAPLWFPPDGDMILTRGSISEIFRRSSYLCKVFSAENDLPFKCKRWCPSHIPTEYIPPISHQVQTPKKVNTIIRSTPEPVLLF